MDIFQLPAFEDNYLYVIRSGDRVAAVDPGDPQVILDFLEAYDLPLHYILNTHHHQDHVGGNLVLKEKTGCRIIGFEHDRDRIPGIDQGVVEGDIFTLGDAPIDVMEMPGHTTGHIGYFAPQVPALFCGDTLFSMGCGRVFEGNPETLWQSLQKIKSLPDNTQIYCAHEYTETNARFALSLDPESLALREKLTSVQKLRRKGVSTVPTRLEEERRLNPFLNCPDVETFVERRRLKDYF